MNIDKIINEDKSLNIKETSNVQPSLYSNTIVVSIILLILIIGLLIHNKQGKNIYETQTFYSFLVVSIILTIIETAFVYWYNVQNIYNLVIDKILSETKDDKFIIMKKLNETFPQTMKTKFKSMYESNLKNVSLIMLIPLLLLGIFIISIVRSLSWSSFPKINFLIIFLNVLLLLLTFGATFVNLGIKSSNKADLQSVIKNFNFNSHNSKFKTSLKIFDIKFIATLLFLTIISLVLPSLFVFKT